MYSTFFLFCLDKKTITLYSKSPLILPFFSFIHCSTSKYTSSTFIHDFITKQEELNLNNAKCRKNKSRDNKNRPGLKILKDTKLKVNIKSKLAKNKSENGLANYALMIKSSPKLFLFYP